MAQKRKLQVFVSSTYTDLIAERQSAVEAILTAGHIPAGMELFAGQNEEQMNIIKRWIDESDVYLLLLGGRYGSVEEKSDKSYTHLEYDYAKATGKPIFVVVAEESYITQKSREKDPATVMELLHRDKYLQFKKDVTGKFVKHWNSSESLQLAIINTLHILDRDENLVGWVPGSEATNSGAIAEEIARLTKENSELREQLSRLGSNSTLYNGFTFDQMYTLLNSEVNIVNMFDPELQSMYGEVAKIFGDERPSLMHIFFIWGKSYLPERKISNNATSFSYAVPVKLSELGILDRNIGVHTTTEKLSNSGRQFYLRLRLERDTDQARKVFDELHRTYKEKLKQTNETTKQLNDLSEE